MGSVGERADVINSPQKTPDDQIDIDIMIFSEASTSQGTGYATAQFGERVQQKGRAQSMIANFRTSSTPLDRYEQPHTDTKQEVSAATCHSVRTSGGRNCTYLQAVPQNLSMSWSPELNHIAAAPPVALW